MSGYFVKKPFPMQFYLHMHSIQPSPWSSKRGRVTGCRELAGCQLRKISELGRARRPSEIRIINVAVYFRELD
jgi:hypothetical protein